MQLIYANQVWIGAGVGTAVLLVLLYLVVSAKLALRKIRFKAVTQEELSAAIATVSKELEHTRSEISEMKKRPTAADMIPEGLALNLNTRGHILRLYRRGESISDIASALRLTKGEVNLIVRVHEMSRLASSDSPVEISV